MVMECVNCKIVLDVFVNLYEVFRELGFGYFESTHLHKFEKQHFGGGKLREQHLSIHRDDLENFEVFIKYNKVNELLEKAKAKLYKFEAEQGYKRSGYELPIGEMAYELLIKHTTKEWCQFYKLLYEHCIEHFEKGEEKVEFKTAIPLRIFEYRT